MMGQLIEVKSLILAKRRAPWAEKIVKVDGGYLAFERDEDYLIWRNQR